jgi:hypothetical protein
MPRTHEQGESPPPATPACTAEPAHEPEGPILRPSAQSPPATRIGLADDSTRNKPSGGRPWYALTTTTSGLLTLQELMEHHPDDAQCGDIPADIHAIQADGKTNRLTRSCVNGDQQTYRITMNYGLTVESTANHLWYVSSSHRPGQRPDRAFVPINQWRATEAIEPGQVIEVQLGVYNQQGGAARFRSIPTTAIRMRGDHSRIVQPEVMNRDLAWLIGYLWGDGAQSPSKYRLRFVDEHLAIIDKASRIIGDHFGLKSEVKRLTDRNAYALEVASVLLWHWCQKNGIIKYEIDDTEDLALIPRVVRSGSAGHIVAFLAGLLDSDGGASLVHTDVKRYVLTTANTRFARHVQDVCWAVGLGVGRSLNDVGRNLQHSKHMFMLTGGIYATEDAFAGLMADSVKVAALEAREPDIDWNHQRTPFNRTIIGKVTSVEAIGIMPTFDVEVAKDPWFFAGAVKSRNSTSRTL